MGISNFVLFLFFHQVSRNIMSIQYCESRKEVLKHLNHCLTGSHAICETKHLAFFPPCSFTTWLCFELYHKYGKIHWTKHLWFQHHEVFVGTLSQCLGQQYYYLTTAKYSQENFWDTLGNCESLAQQNFPHLLYQLLSLDTTGRHI